MIELIIAGGLAVAGYRAARNFVRGRLRFVDAAQTPAAPFVAGGVVAVVVLPFAALPLIGIGTAVAAGIGVGAGVASAQRDRKLLE